MAPQRVDITGQRFGKLRAVRFHHRTSDRRSMWLCVCDCGNESVVALGNLRSGTTQSCGCGVRAAHTTHGHSPKGAMSPEYSTWHAMKRRCFSPQVANYAYYGGRGIGVCERWKESFGAFLADMGPRPSPDHTLDRIDPDADYCPENCRWATRSEQQRNKRNNRLVTLDGESITLAEACERLNLPYKTIQHRLQLGWSEHRALHEPLRRRRAA